MEENVKWIIVTIFITLFIIVFIVSLIISRYKGKLREKELLLQNNTIEKDGKIRELELTMQAIQADLKGASQDLAKKWFDQWKVAEWEGYKKKADQAGEEMGKMLFAKWCREHEDRIRKDNSKRTIAITMGKMTEHLIPFSEQFKEFNSKDARFIGSPVDLILFDGVADNKPDITIYFIEVKTGQSALTPIQRKIWRAIEDGRVKWKMIKRDEFKWGNGDQSTS